MRPEVYAEEATSGGEIPQQQEVLCQDHTAAGISGDSSLCLARQMPEETG